MDIKSNPKICYAYVRSKTKVKEVVSPLKDNNGQLVSESGVMCKILNDYFGSVFTSEDLVNELRDIKCKFSKDNDHMLSNIEIMRDIVLNKLNKLNSDKAPCVDGIVPRILVENSDVLSEPLLYIFKKSIECGRVPSDWKKANVSRRVIKPHHVILGLLAQLHKFVKF